MSGTPTADTTAGNPTRELAAIMFSDIAGYTAIMGRDEQQAIRALAGHRELMRSLVPRFNGRIIGDIGDGTLSSFHSALDAVNCARETQAALDADDKLRVRIGIHVGDVLFSDNQVIGDGVNVASRIHALAPPGGICVSEHVYDEIRNKPGIYAKDLGKKRLKNVSRPIRVYALATTALPDQPRTPRWTRRALAAGAAVLLIIVLVYGIEKWKLVTGSAQQLVAQPRVIRSIAVLPLDNLSRDPSQEYFADGMTEELITDLAKISALRVISRTSVMKFKGEHREQLPEIAKTLNVDAVVEGSVLQVGNRVRITAQLIDAPADKHLWANSYDRDARDVLAVQDEIASAIAREINVELTPSEKARLTKVHTVNPQAHEAYLKGRYFLDLERLNEAIAQFEQAIKLDPNFAPAYAGLADAYLVGEGFYLAPSVIPKAKDAVEKALQLDDTSAEVHEALALFKYAFAYDWAGSETEIRRAIALNPSYAEAHHEYGWVMAAQGRGDEALAEFKRASELDPLSARLAGAVSLELAYQGKYEAAKRQCHEALDLDPNISTSTFCIWLPDLEAGKFKEAIAEMEKAKLQESSSPVEMAQLGYCYGASGDRTRAMAMLEKLNQMASRQYVSPLAEAVIYIGVGDHKRALDRLEQVYQTGSSMLFWLKISHQYDSLRSEPRFIALLKKVGLDK